MLGECGKKYAVWARRGTAQRAQRTHRSPMAGTRQAEHALISARHTVRQHSRSDGLVFAALDVENIAMRRRTAPEGFMPPKTASFLLARVRACSSRFLSRIKSLIRVLVLYRVVGEDQIYVVERNPSV